jgi:hypothetical protein
MIKRIENWLRRIFADEVGKVETALKGSFARELQRVETSLAWEGQCRVADMVEIRDRITADLKQFRADLVAERLLVAAPQHWKADTDVVKADNQLIHRHLGRNGNK